MLRSSSSLVALCAALLASAPALAADIDGWGGGMRQSYSLEPKDWTELGDQTDPISIETGIRYWYSFGSQNFGSGSTSLGSTDTAHIGELHLRIDDHSTNTYAKAIGGYSFKIDGSYSGSGGSGTIGDGHVGYVGADIGWNALGDNDGSGIGPFVGYLYWQDAPDTGRFNYATGIASFNAADGQVIVGGDSAPNFVETHALRLGLGGKARLGDFFDVSGELAAVPYARVTGTVGVDDPTFSNAVYHGPAQLPYAGAGNISSIRSSATNIDGWAYGAMAEGWIGVHPTENLALRLGGRLWYLQGTVDSTYSRATIPDPVLASGGTTYEQPAFNEASFISSNNPFKMMRAGILAELTYSF